MSKAKSLGKYLNPILKEIEIVLWEKEANFPFSPHNFNLIGFRAGLKIFTAVLLDQAYKDMERLKLNKKDKEERALALASRLKRLILEFTNIDTGELYK